MKDRRDLYTEHCTEHYKTLVRHLSHDGAFGTPIKTEDFYTTHQRCPNLPALPPSSSLIRRLRLLPENRPPPGNASRRPMQYPSQSWALEQPYL